MDDIDRRQRAQKARLELDLTEGAFDALREGLIARWAASNTAAQAERESLFYAVQALDAVRGVLIQAAQDADYIKASDDLAEMLKPKVKPKVANG